MGKEEGHDHMATTGALWQWCEKEWPKKFSGVVPKCSNSHTGQAWKCLSQRWKTASLGHAAQSKTVGFDHSNRKF